MANKDNVKKIKSYIDEVLGTKSSLRDKLPAKISYKRDLFCEVLQNLSFFLFFLETENGNLILPLNIDETSETSAEVVADGPAPSP